jgi:hypothetical protein
LFALVCTCATRNGLWYSRRKERTERLAVRSAAVRPQKGPAARGGSGSVGAVTTTNTDAGTTLGAPDAKERGITNVSFCRGRLSFQRQIGLGFNKTCQQQLSGF